MKKIIVAIDSFKGSLTSAEANQAASEGVLLRMPDAEVVQVPVSDGGDELRYRPVGGGCCTKRLQAYHSRTGWKCHQRLRYRHAKGYYR